MPGRVAIVRTLLAGLAAATLCAPAPAQVPTVERLLDEAQALRPLQTVVVSHQGRIVAERGYRGHTVTAATNIKSASKAVISALVGIAIDKRVLEGPDQRVAQLLAQDLPAKPDPRMQRLTVGHLLSMQAGLGSTSSTSTSQRLPTR